MSVEYFFYVWHVYASSMHALLHVACYILPYGEIIIIIIADADHTNKWMDGMRAQSHSCLSKRCLLPGSTFYGFRTSAFV